MEAVEQIVAHLSEKGYRVNLLQHKDGLGWAASIYALYFSKTLRPFVSADGPTLEAALTKAICNLEAPEPLRRRGVVHRESLPSMEELL